MFQSILRSSFLFGKLASGSICNRASVKYGVIVTEIKGKVGGHVFKGTNQGGVLQTKTNKSKGGVNGSKLTKADAGRLINPIANSSANASAWKTLTSEQRLAWNAAAVDFPFINKFGQPYTASGFQLYMSVNNNLVNAGIAPLSEPPSPSEIENCPSFVIANEAGDPTNLKITVDIPVGYVLTLYASNAMSAGRSLELGKMKAIKIMPSGDVTDLVIAPDYLNVFGTLSVDDNIWFYGKLTKADAGRSAVNYTVQYQVA